MGTTLLTYTAMDSTACTVGGTTTGTPGAHAGEGGVGGGDAGGGDGEGGDGAHG